MGLRDRPRTVELRRRRCLPTDVHSRSVYAGHVAGTALPIFEFADRFVDEQSALDPNSATGRGIPGFDHLLTDMSPTGYEQRNAHLRNALAEVRALPITNDDDRRALDFITERFEVSLATFDAGNWLRAISAISWPGGHLRLLFDLMPATQPTPGPTSSPRGCSRGPRRPAGDLRLGPLARHGCGTPTGTGGC